MIIIMAIFLKILARKRDIGQELETLQVAERVADAR